MKYICFGEVLFDCLPSGPVLGGAPLNVSYHLSMLNDEGWVLSALGKDELGDRAEKEIKEKGQSLSLITRVDEPTGRADITLNNGDADYMFNYPCSWDVISISNDNLPKEVDLIYFGTLAQRSEKSRKTLENLLDSVKAKEVFFDVNIRKEFYSKEIILNGLIKSTILKMNEDELPVILSIAGINSEDYRKNVEKLADKYDLKYIILTKGGNGSEVYSPGSWTEVEVEKNVNVVDTVGAGDSLSAGFCHVLLKTRDEKKALRIGSKIAGYVVTQRGAMPQYSESLVRDLSKLLD